LEVYLGTDSEVLPHHATIQVEGGEHVVLPEAGPVSVNGSSTTRHSLKDGDVLQLGRTKLRYSARKLGTLR
jgi:pSer/pThr/pTyr-binding forkhead associated (FHA) protein